MVGGLCQAERQALTAVFPNSCPAGSQHCDFVSMSRGPMPPPYRQTCAGIRCPSVGLSARARTWLTVSYCYPAVLDNALPAAKVAHVGRCAGEIEWMSRVYRRKYREEDSA